jgi:hypothetical protein
MGRPTRIRHGTDRPEPVAAKTVGNGVSDALKSRVNRAGTRIAWMTIAAIDVALPDFDAQTAQWPPVLIEDMAIQISDLTRCRLFPSRDMRQIIVIIQRQFHGVERTGRLARGRASQARHDRHGMHGQ